MQRRDDAHEVWITGIGLASSLGDGGEVHTALLTGTQPCVPNVDETRYAPYPVHPLAPLPLARQIPRNSDQHQMDGWQRLGVYAAGQALDDAGLKGHTDLLDRTDLMVAAGSGERDTAVDCRVLEASSTAGGASLSANEILPSALRPTRFLAQLSNLLAGNISIVHHVTGASRTFMGEEAAGLAAIDNAFRRIAAGQCELCLVGGALNAEREDLLLGYELGHNLWPRPWLPVRQRGRRGGGFIPGSVGAFLVLEQRRHAEARFVRPYARLSAVAVDRAHRWATAETDPLAMILGQVRDRLAPGTTAVFSGASGVAPVTTAELAFLDELRAAGRIDFAWVYGDLLGHAVEAHFPAGIALAALAQRARRVSLTLVGGSAGQVSAVERIVVTGIGHGRGEGVAVIEPVVGSAADEP